MFVEIPKIETEYLPSLCVGKGCLNDPLPKKLFCEGCAKKDLTRKERKLRLLTDKAVLERKRRDGLTNIYFIRCINSGFIKIGKAENVMNRLHCLQVGSTSELELVGSLEAPPAREKELHVMFDQYRVRGEWFQPSNEIMKYIAAYA